MDLWDLLEEGKIKKPLRLFCPPESAKLLREGINGVTVVACDRLDDAVYHTWPEMRSGGTAAASGRGAK